MISENGFESTPRRPMRRGSRMHALAFAVLAFAPLCASATAPFAVPTAQGQDPLAKPDPKKEAAKTVAYLTAWPKPSDKEKDQIMTDIDRVCVAHTVEMGKQGQDSLITTGDMAAPFVMERYGRERNDDARKRLHEVLVKITGAEHTRLLAREFTSKLVPVRTFALWRASYFPDPEVKKDAEAAWQRLAKQGDKADPDERYAAALCCASTGSIAGFEGLYDATSKQWDKKRDELRAALNGCRGPAASALAIKKLEGADRKVKVAVLHMLAGCGDKASAAIVKPFLDEEDNSIRVAAINALRGMVDNDDPIEGLSAFEAIELAKKWKAKQL